MTRDSDATRRAETEGLERWLPCVGHEGRYEVSDRGRVRSIPRRGTKGGILKSWPDHNGYLTVCLDRKFVTIHRVVAQTFHPTERNQLHNQVAHIDGSRTNNRADNLKWVSHRENQWHKVAHGTHPVGERNPQAKLTWAEVEQIRSATGTRASLAEKFGVSIHTIADIKRGRKWKQSPNRCIPHQKVPSMTDDKLLELATRCEQATGPDAELDSAISEATGAWKTWPTFVSFRPTASLDAAMTLVPEGCVFSWDGVERVAEVYRAPKPFMHGYDRLGSAKAATPALALCAASLRSLANKETEK